MALNFPSSPSANDTYTYSGRSWTYTNNAWALTTTTLSTSVVPEGTNLYFTNARATAAVTNTSLSNLTISGNVVAGNVNISTSGVLKFPDGTTQITAAAGSGVGFVNSTTTTFPGHSGNIDYGDLTDTGTDAFGVALVSSYDCMEPKGSMVLEDLAVI